MTAPQGIPQPVEVNIKNWTDNPARPPVIKRTMLKTYLLDPAGLAGPKNVQIGEFEPKRARIVVQVLEAPVGLYTSVPSSSPDNAGLAGQLSDQGRYLPNSLAFEYAFYGPDVFWINSLGTLTRVTVTKEYFE